VLISLVFHLEFYLQGRHQEIFHHDNKKKLYDFVLPDLTILVPTKLEELITRNSFFRK